MAVSHGKWHNKRRHFGLHYDLHAREKDTDIGRHATARELVPMLKLAGCQWVQTDCKGHAGYTSWHSQTPGASVSPGVRRDALRGWREATQQLGLPLHCHYSGIWDSAAGAKHPGWTRDLGPRGDRRSPGAWGPRPRDTMCPRGPYVRKLMIPQMLELIDRYQVDGFWVDGEIWAVEPCYCARCRQAFQKATGITEPPTETSDPNWIAWMNFTRESFEEYVTRYAEAVHQHKPGVLVCSNWLQTLRHPGEPKVPTDWISGDNVWAFGLDWSRCEARFLSTRGKPWDIMIWSFYKSGDMESPIPWCPKPVQMIQQEAAVVVALGGNVMVYESPQPLRDGRLVDWRMKRLGQVGGFVKARRALCQGAETIPQVAVLHSEHHVRSQPAKNLLWDIDVTAVQGATCCLLENHYGVDLMDEWALLPRLADFPVVVAPEQDRMSEQMVEALKEYVRGGGKLLVSGARAYERFGGEFLGVAGGKVEREARYYLSAADGATPAISDTWRLVRPTAARALGRLGSTPLLEQELLPHPAATVNRVGKGKVGYLPFDAFRYFQRSRFPMMRAFIGEVAAALAGRQAIQVEGPTCVDVVLRRKEGRTMIHLINRSSGLPNRPDDGSVDEIPEVGPIRVEMRSKHRPSKVSLAWEEGKLSWTYASGKGTERLTARLERLHIHAAIVVE